MWFQKADKFLYIFFSKYTCINNRTGIFKHTFEVKEEEKLRWASNGRSLQLAPELITYWSKEDAL